MSLFSRKESSIALSHRKVYALNAVLAAVKLIVDGKMVTRDYAVFQRALIEAPNGGTTCFTRVAGHFYGSSLQSSSFSAEVHVRVYEDKEPQMECDIVGVVVIDDYWKYRVEWLADGRFRTQRWENDSIVEGWKYSDELKLLDELNFSPRLENFLYANRIRTLGHILAWTSVQLREVGIEEALLEELKKNLESRGYILDAAR